MAQVAVLLFECDECNEESDAWPHWKMVRRQAIKDGWKLGPKGAALCPDCRLLSPGGAR